MNFTLLVSRMDLRTEWAREESSMEDDTEVSVLGNTVSVFRIGSSGG